jgi:polyhydroxybutyrate depolymerase
MMVGLMTLAVVASACSQTSSAGPSNSSSTSDRQAATTATTLAPEPSAGCSLQRHPELTLVKQNITVDGVARWYLISTPPTSDSPPSASGRPLPLVLDFHGLDEGASLEALTTQFGPLGQKDGFITVFPDGTGNPLHWNTDTGGGNQDVDFVSEMLDQIEADQCVDETRIYATGLSDGAFMTSLLACEMSDRIAAFAPVSGVQLPTPCEATRRVPILAFHGTADPILHFNGGVGTSVLKHALGGSGPAPSLDVPPANLNGPGYPATVAAWAKRDGCGSKPVDTKVSPHVIHRVYPCPTGVEVEFYIILGGGHAWPGSHFSEEIAAVTGPTTFEINATTLIWAFFERFQV